MKGIKSKKTIALLSPITPNAVIGDNGGDKKTRHFTNGTKYFCFQPNVWGSNSQYAISLSNQKGVNFKSQNKNKNEKITLAGQRILRLEIQAETSIFKQ